MIVVSDSHLSDRTPEAAANWDAVIEHVAAVGPDLVVHAGDISADGGDRADDLEFARDRLDRLDVPVVVVPGNHDVGDTPSAGPDHGPDVGAARLARFRAVFGADRFSVGAGRWRLVGIDAQLLAAGGDDEAEQWAWIESELDGLDDGTPLVVVSHKPLVPARGDSDRPVRYIRPAARERLIALLGRVETRLVVSGHVHQALRHQRSGLDHVWAPSTWAVLPDSLQERVGAKVPGVVELTLHTGGGADVTTFTPAGMRHLVVGVDIDDPYDGSASPAVGD